MPAFSGTGLMDRYHTVSEMCPFSRRPLSDDGTVIQEIPVPSVMGTGRNTCWIFREFLVFFEWFRRAAELSSDQTMTLLYFAEGKRKCVLTIRVKTSGGPQYCSLWNFVTVRLVNLRRCRCNVGNLKNNRAFYNASIFLSFGMPFLIRTFFSN